MRLRVMVTISAKQNVRCSLSVAAMCFLVSASCLPPPSPGLSYSLQVSSAPPRQMTIHLLMRGWSGPHLDLRGHSPSDVMLVKNFAVSAGNGQRLRWVECFDTVRVRGSAIKLSNFRILGPIPSSLSV